MLLELLPNLAHVPSPETVLAPAVVHVLDGGTLSGAGTAVYAQRELQVWHGMEVEIVFVLNHSSAHVRARNHIGFQLPGVSPKTVEVADPFAHPQVVVESLANHRAFGVDVYLQDAPVLMNEMQNQS